MNKYEEALKNITTHFCNYCKKSNCVKCDWHESLRNLEELVSKTQEKYGVVDLHNKCGACIYLDYESKVVNLYECRCPKKIKPLTTQRTAKACRFYEKRNDIDLTYKYKKGRVREE